MMSISVLLVVLFCLICAVSPKSIIDLCDYASTHLISEYGYILTYSALALMLIEIAIACSPYGKIRRGVVEYSNLAYWSMICASGIGIAPIFYAVIEPVSHVEEGLSVVEAMQWSFHNWMIGAGTYYCAFALSTYCLSFNANRLGKIVNGLLTIATAIGLALTFLYVISLLETPVLPSILAITALTVISSVLHINYGLRPISYLTICCTLVLISTVGYYFDLSITSWLYYLSQYLIYEIPMYFSPNHEWLAQWTYNYYAQWLGCSLWLGLFVAKISSGRTLREIVIACLIVPPILASLYFSILGQAAIQTSATTTQQLLSAIPHGHWLSLLVSVLCITFFVVQNDGSSLVLEQLSKTNRLIWIILIACITYFISMIDNAVDLMRTITTLVSWPILLLLVYLFSRFLWRLYHEHI